MGGEGRIIAGVAWVGEVWVGGEIGGGGRVEVGLGWWAMGSFAGMRERPKIWLCPLHLFLRFWMSFERVG